MIPIPIVSHIRPCYRFVDADIFVYLFSALLDSVKVMLPDGGGLTSLSSVASITVKGMTLFVEVYDAEVCLPYCIT